GFAVAEQFVNFGFRASHNGQPQPSALWWRWQRRDGRYWVQGQWRSYPAGQAPFVQVGSGILEGSPTAPPDTFAALWRFDVQDVAATAWPFSAPGSAQGTSALFFDGDLALDVQVD